MAGCHGQYVLIRQYHLPVTGAAGESVWSTVLPITIIGLLNLLHLPFRHFTELGTVRLWSAIHLHGVMALEFVPALFERLKLSPNV